MTRKSPKENRSKRQSAADGANTSAGYGRPPTTARFRPGHSGNPKGRRKGSKNVKTIIKNTLLSSAAPLQDDLVKGASNFEKIVRVQTHHAINGDHRFARNVNNYAKDAGLFAAPPANDTIKLSPADEQILQLIIERLLESERGNEDELSDKSKRVPNEKGNPS